MSNLADTNNNPGNLKDPATGTFRQFKDPGEGFAALLNDLDSKRKGATSHGLGPNSTLAEFGKVYAPPSDKNDSAQYVANLANHMGVRPDAAISSLDLGKWAEAVASAEGYKGELSHDSKQSENPSFFSEVGGDIVKRAKQAGQVLSDVSSQKINPASGFLQGAGTILGGIGDLTGDVISHTPVVGKVVNGIGGLLGKGINKLAQTDTGQKVIGGYSDWSKKHPEAAGNISAGGDILSGLASIEGAGALKSGLMKGVAKAAGRDALSGIVDAISPEVKAGSKAASKDILKNGIKNPSLLTGTIRQAEDPALRQAAQVIKETVPKFEKLKTATEQFNAIDDGIGKLATDLRTNLSGEFQPILTLDDVNGLDNQIKLEIAKNPVLVGDPGKQAQLIYDHFKELLPKGRDITMNDVLDARQGLDRWITKIKGGGAFDPKMENAFSTALRAVRQGANNLMESKVPNAGVKALLKKQSLLYDAMENLAPKAGKELGTSGLSRYVGRHPLMTGLLKKGVGYSAAGLGLGVGSNLTKK